MKGAFRMKGSTQMLVEDDGFIFSTDNFLVHLDGALRCADTLFRI
jgi:hypothetical protein